MVMVNENGAFERVERVEPVELDTDVYDLDIEQTHNFVAGGIVTHNSVYAFRGADYRNLLRFEESFPDASVIVLDQNYRSTQRILDAANAVIANNAARRPKHLWTEQIGGELIVRYHAEDEHDEAQFVVHEINRLADQEGCASATPRSSTGRTPRAASSRRRSCAPACRTASSAAPSSTTGAR